MNGFQNKDVKVERVDSSCGVYSIIGGFVVFVENGF